MAGGTGILREKRGHVEVAWELQKFLDLLDKEGEWVESPTVLLIDTLWFLRIYPKNDPVILHLWKSRGSCEHPYLLSFAIKAGDSVLQFREYFKKFNGLVDSFEYPQPIDRTSISKILKREESDGTLTVTCTIRLLHCAPAPKSEGSEGHTLSRNFRDMFLDGNFSDIKLKIGEREFDVHRNVLACRSPSLAAMFQQNCRVVQIRDVDPEHAENFLLFLYTGESELVTPVNAESLYKAAHKYKLEELKDACRIRMSIDLCLESVLDVFQLAVIHNESELLNNVMEFFCKNAAEIVETPKFDVLYSQNAPMAMKLLAKLVEKQL